MGDVHTLAVHALAVQLLSDPVSVTASPCCLPGLCTHLVFFCALSPPLLRMALEETLSAPTHAQILHFAALCPLTHRSQVWTSRTTPSEFQWLHMAATMGVR